MGGCQNYGPFLGILNIRCRIIMGIQKGTIILTTTHMGTVITSPLSLVVAVSGWGVRSVRFPSEESLGGLGFRVWSLGFRFWGLGFRVQSFQKEACLSCLFVSFFVCLEKGTL